MQSMRASLIVTSPATLHCLDLEVLDVVELRATNIIRSLPCTKSFAWTEEASMLESMNKNQQANCFLIDRKLFRMRVFLIIFLISVL